MLLEQVSLSIAHGLLLSFLLNDFGGVVVVDLDVIKKCKVLLTATERWQRLTHLRQA
jgi:hypothetical protein